MKWFSKVIQVMVSSWGLSGAGRDVQVTEHKYGVSSAAIVCHLALAVRDIGFHSRFDLARVLPHSGHRSLAKLQGLGDTAFFFSGGGR
uniref:Uncharacterized protein n=1 Tax=Knipowitschia caucasica TaxID=637954 RepID=A0AAV2KW54_KNICA